MALRTLMLRKKIADAKKQRDALGAKDAEFEQREKSLEADIEAAQTDEERSAVEEAIGTFETERNDHETAKSDLDQTIRDLEKELDEMEKEAETPAPAPAPEAGENNNERMVNTTMETRERFSVMTLEQRSAIVARDDVKEFLTRARTLMPQNRAVNSTDLLIPEVMLGLIRHEIAHSSKLLPHVRLVNVSGVARQRIAGDIPEAVWTEMCAKINELDIGFNQIEVDGYKVGGYIAICNATLADSDINLANEIITAIGGAIAKALDKAILFGTGTKMPLGIVTRLAQESQPSNWGTDAPTWTDLHSTNIIKANIDTYDGKEFFAKLIEYLAVAKPYYNSDDLTWIMNRKTHLHIMAKALAFNSAAALVSNTSMMPIIGGTVVEMEDDEITDNEIIGGFFGNYLMAQREGITYASSDIPRFLEEQTVFKGTARYDGTPIAGEAFVVLNFANTDPTTSKTFPEDYANADMNTLTLVAAAGSTTGKTVITVTDYLATSDPTLQYKLGDYSGKIDVGDTVSSWTDLTSGTTEITAAAGKIITVVELDSNSKVVSIGTVASVPKT